MQQSREERVSLSQGNPREVLRPAKSLGLPWDKALEGRGLKEAG